MKVKDGFEIPVKRFYLEGVVLKGVCPECGKTVKQDLGEQYLSYPNIGKNKETIYSFNEETEHECEVEVEFTLEIKVEQTPNSPDRKKN